MRNLLLLLLPLSLTPLACGADDPAREGPLVRDSAGIAIVENRDPLWNTDDAWRVSARPVLDIGAVDGPAEAQLFRARSARRLPDGGVLVVNGGTNELRFYGPDGRHERSVGREGAGPGEFQGLWDAWGQADSVLAFDMRLGRVTVFGPGGSVARTFSPGGAGAREQVVGVLGDGSLITRRSHSPGMVEHLIEVDLFHRAPDGSALDSIGRFPDRLIIPVWIDERSVMMSSDIFGPAVHFAVGSEHVYVATAREPEVEARTPGADVVRLIRWRDPDRQVTASDRDLYRENTLASIEDPRARARVERQFGDARWADRFPPLDDLLVDTEGNLWARRFRRPGAAGASVWMVFDPDGRLLGPVELPDDFRPIEIGADWVLGLAVDELDVQHARLYRLDKSSGG